MMKKYFNNYIAAAALAVVTLFASCTKEAGVFKEGGSDGIIELADLKSRTSTTPYAVSAINTFVNTAEVELPVKVNYTGVNGATEDVTLTWEIDNSIVKVASANYTALPTGFYSLPTNNTVVIPKGKKSAQFIVKLNMPLFSTTPTYGLGVSLKSASSGTISGNYGTGVILVKAKNP